VETRAGTDDRDDFGIIRHFRGEKNNRNKHQNGHEGDDQIHDPERVKINQKLAYGKSVRFNSWCFCLHINYQNDDTQKSQHKPEGAEVLFDDIQIDNFHAFRR
jgi:hypothetical protein